MAWAPSTVLNMNSFLYLEMARAHIRTTSSWGNSGAIGPTCGRTQGISTMSKQGEEGNLLALHPTVKPVQMIADAILDASGRGEIVLDGFLGSGSTLLAAERVGRICYGIEIDPLYVDVAIQRWQRYTGEKATLQSTGKTYDEVASTLEVNHG